MDTNDASETGPAAPSVACRDEAAFPLREDDRNYGQTGMTLRDYFAGQALAGMGELQLVPESAAHAAYEYADAMLRERAKRG